MQPLTVPPIGSIAGPKGLSTATPPAPRNALPRVLRKLMDSIRTPLSSLHEALGARMVPFAGYWMPIQYTSILDEARHVRKASGLFDLCHMGRFWLQGDDVIEQVDRLVTSNIRSMKDGMIRYGLLTREDGTIIDDILAYREPDGIFLCVNAANRARDLAWIQTHLAGTGTEVRDLSDDLAMIAIQGPASVEVARHVCAEDPGALGYYRLKRTKVLDDDGVMVSRTGYTGEDGFEFYVPTASAEALWKALTEAGGEGEVLPIGLGARDTLRLEAGMPLYGHEIDDSTTPIEAGLGWAIDKSYGFVGGDAIRQVAEEGASRRLVGFICEGKRVAREGYPVLCGDDVVSDVRSGTQSPTLDRPIGTAYLPSTIPSTGAALAVDCRGTRAPIEIVDLPFYKRDKK